MQLWTQQLTLPLTLALTLALSPIGAQARDPYWGADARSSDRGGREFSTHSSHFHGRGGFAAWPNRWSEGHGPRSNHGHTGDINRYGRFATPPGHASAAYVPQRLFDPGAYGRRHCQLFHYEGEWDRRE